MTCHQNSKNGVDLSKVKIEMEEMVKGVKCRGCYALAASE
jgi:hypothetical protein